MQKRIGFFRVMAALVCALVLVGCSPKEKETGKEKGNLPDLPAANVKNGQLDSHEGKNEFVTKNNLEAFAKEFDAAMNGSARAARALGNPDYTQTISGLSGKLALKMWFVFPDDTDDFSRTKTTMLMTYNNYSESGTLFCGGELASATYMNNNYGSFESKMNGEILFNGAYSGSVVYDNFYVKWDGKKLTISGKLTVKSNGVETNFEEYYEINLQDDLF